MTLPNATTAFDAELKAEGAFLTVSVESLAVVDQAGYEAANALIERCDTALKRIAEVHDPVIKAAHTTHKAALDAKKRLAEPIETLKKAASKKMTVWYQAEQARVAEERRKAEEAARREAEEQRLREAEALVQAGMSEAASVALDAPLDIASFIKAPELPVAASGISYRANWKAELVDFKSLIQAVAAGQLPDTVLLPNMPALNQMAKAYRNTREIPGVRQFNDITQAKRYA
jgi:hypothetical protein